MAKNTHSDSVHGDVTTEIVSSSDNVFVTNDTNPVLLKQRDQDQLYSSLPAAQTEGGAINFLGSSFTGSDIKVVAHLYDSDDGAGTESRTQKLTFERDVASAVVDGCFNLATSGISGLVQQQSEGNPLFFRDFSAKRELFIAATGLNILDEINQRAINVLTSQILGDGNFTFLGGQAMRRRTEAVLKAFQLDLESAQQRLEALADIEKTSSQTVVLGTLQTLSVQSFREKNAVRALGHSYAKGYTRGARTIGGTMIFTVFNEHALLQLIRALGQSKNYGERDADLSTLLADQIPPVDLTIAFANEYGAISERRLYGVEWVTDSEVYSIEDLLSENTMNFVARDADVLTSKGNIRISRLQRGMYTLENGQDITGSSLLFSDDNYNSYIEKLGVRRRLLNR